MLQTHFLLRTVLGGGKPGMTDAFCLQEVPHLVDETKDESRSVISDSLQPHGLYSPWNSLSQNTGVGSFSLFQGIFPTQGSNLGLPSCSQILLPGCKSQGVKSALIDACPG